MEHENELRNKKAKWCRGAGMKECKVMECKSAGAKG